MALPLSVIFAAGAAGPWRIDRLQPVRGAGLSSASRLAVLEGPDARSPDGVAWILRGTTSNSRYAHAAEQERLVAKQPPLGRSQATMSALIPIRKTAAWWDLAQDQRRKIFEEQSRHIEIGLEYLPAVARRLYHCRDFGEPFDFLTWFEYAPADAEAFEALVRKLRQSEEWRYVEREVDVRLTRIDP
jgi:chlorite dismutase